MMDQLKEAREKWIKEKDKYETNGEIVAQEIQTLFKDKGIPVTVTHRVKTTESLLKKILNNRKRYEDLSDKLGLRIVAHFLSDLDRLDSIIQKRFNERIIKRENKKETMDDSTFGYQAIHYDIHDTEKGILFEIQLRTMCQNAWSELAHVLSYKPDTDNCFDNEVIREINALSALMEIADNQFQKIRDITDRLAPSHPNRVLRHISDFFYSHIAAWYDIEMSQHFLDEVDSLYDSDEDVLETLENFIKANGEDIHAKAEERPDVLFFTQPEIVVILERLENRKFELIEYWEKKYPIEQLEHIANAWGTSLDIDG